MGRKPKAAKVAEATADMPNILTPAVEMAAPQHKMHTKATCLSSGKNTSSIIRRSERLRHVAPTAQNQETEPVVEEVNLCESEKEDEPLIFCESAKEDGPFIEENTPESMTPEWSLEERINYLVQAVEELKSKATKRHIESDSPAANLNYKSMYIDSQKKIEALTSENFELSKKLEVALGKMEAYGEANRVCSEILNKLKDLLAFSNLAKATETAISISSQAILGRFSFSGDIGEPEAQPPALPQTSAKRKRYAKVNKGN
ncbi:Processed lymphoid-restricted membrane protein [Actinidia chinensis var. chinensis]|uniref:Processed lymphoid-restricted membrane protein n=1 Tax=Actinidia chinensis var. chinensis TaxID=1590841 RepID=A0A2R6QE07_ACTCC|nr:Processed lymphoid-restricted membrane protein [Actinidia chinensis var. chinensis]